MTMLAPQAPVAESTADRVGPRARHWAGSRGARLAVGAIVVAILVQRFGLGPLVDGLRATRPWQALAALIITAGTTWCCSVRWSRLASRAGHPVPVRTAYAAYYRSQLINATVPGGVVGDLDRGVRHGLRPVVLDRVIGQAAQVGLVAALLLPAPGRWAVVLAIVATSAAAWSRGGDLVLLSLGSSAGHLVVFLIAAGAVAGSGGAGLPLTALVPIGALVLLGSAIPFNVAGWGPREGVAVWAFTSHGASAAAGLSAAVSFGALAALATLPGLLVLVLGLSRRG
jgi:hypothetical protein